MRSREPTPLAAEGAQQAPVPDRRPKPGPKKGGARMLSEGQKGKKAGKAAKGKTVAKEASTGKFNVPAADRFQVNHGTQPDWKSCLVYVKQTRPDGFSYNRRSVYYDRVPADLLVDSSSAKCQGGMNGVWQCKAHLDEEVRTSMAVATCISNCLLVVQLRKILGGACG